MGLDGEWYCPKCETGNYLTKDCRKCGYTIELDNPLIKGNPIKGQSSWTEPMGKFAIIANELKIENMTVKNLTELLAIFYSKPTETEKYIVGFGKFKGKKVKEISNDYIEWALKEIEKPDEMITLFEHCKQEGGLTDTREINSYMQRYYGFG